MTTGALLIMQGISQARIGWTLEQCMDRYGNETDIHNPFMITPETVAQYFPKAVQWANEMEKDILERGQRLSPQSRKDAEGIGIQRIDDVRIAIVDRIPLPNDPGLKQLVLETGLITDETAGMTFGHGIVLKNGSYDRRLIAHELSHVMQYERFGGIEAFLKEYVKEVAFPPWYPNGPLEREAERAADCVIKSL
jgi:uncharacterized protein DUF4157